MKPLPFTPLFVAWLLFTSSAPAGPGSDDDSAATWLDLFNGTDLSGWTVKCKPADRDYPFWKVADGTIVADSMSGPKPDYVWLMTHKEYGDFVLRLEFQAFRDSPGNSGVQIRSRYDDAAGWLDGPQVDIIDRHLLFRREWSVPDQVWSFKAKRGGIVPLPSAWSAFRGWWAADHQPRKAVQASRRADPRATAAANGSRAGHRGCSSPSSGCPASRAAPPLHRFPSL